MRTTPRRFDPHGDDFDCIMYGSLGMSTKFIARKTGLTQCQVGYRLNKSETKRSDYRDGTSRIATVVQVEARSKLIKTLHAELKKRGLRE